VVFSAGNGHFGFPGQHPDVISAGGVYLAQDGSTQASNYASGFASAIYPGRNVPDLSGLVGMLPRAAYIMLPLEPNDEIDRDLGNGSAFPDGDETPNNDGWAAISGTSAAAPQLAGTAALVRQACPRLTPAQVRDVMKSTARDVTAGHNFNRPGMNNAAVAGPDLATGTGLVDAARAVMVAKLRCIRPIGPIRPITVAPVQPVQPVQPIRPITVAPVQPVLPITPVQPVRPISPGPVVPVQPPRPIAPVVNPGPITPADEAAYAAEEGIPLTDDDVAALEDIIRTMGDDLGL
jgi:subtilisin family serine protease